ncbi:MAG: hypothetical protein GY846_14450 [Deltaproteobacteria bacterium]|nr:hypothetical protein [Deltaproteobacteria bacterium]
MRKTTLAQTIAEEYPEPLVYCDLENPEDLFRPIKTDALTSVYKPSRFGFNPTFDALMEAKPSGQPKNLKL